MFIRYEEAERDCTQAISLDGSYSKAFARRGTARTFLGKINEAKQGKTTVILSDEVPRVRSRVLHSAPMAQGCWA